MVNCPIDPAAVPTPNTMLRLLASTERANTESTIASPAPPNPVPISTPADRISSVLVWECDMPQ